MVAANTRWELGELTASQSGIGSLWRHQPVEDKGSQTGEERKKPQNGKERRRSKAYQLGQQRALQLANITPLVVQDTRRAAATSILTKWSI